MGILKDAIKKGISEGVSKAVGQVTQNVIAPAVNNLAEAASAKVNEVASEVSADVNEANENLQQASSQVNLSELFSGYVNAATEFAGNVAANMKECPQCGELALKDCEFCPKCGARLPEETLSDGFVCADCGAVNPLGSSHCTKCGGKLKNTIVQEKKAAEQWSDLLAVYPFWNGGGSDFSIEELDERNGYPMYMFKACYTSEDSYKKYVSLLEQSGFSSPKGYEGSLVTKEIDGINRVVSYQDCYSDGVTEIYFYVEEYKPVAEAKPSPTLSSLISDNQETIDKAAAAAKDVANSAAKALSGLFGKKK